MSALRPSGIQFSVNNNQNFTAQPELQINTGVSGQPQPRNSMSAVNKNRPAIIDPIIEENYVKKTNE